MRTCKVCGRTSDQASFWRSSRHLTCRECHSLKRTGRGLRCLRCGERKEGYGKFCGRQCQIRYYTKTAPTTDCWNWTGYVDKKGYGKVGVKIAGRITSQKAHRVSYEAFCGPIGPFEILHLCHNPRCVNPEHLRPGTPKENNATRLMRKPRADGMTRRQYALAKWRGQI